MCWVAYFLLYSSSSLHYSNHLFCYLVTPFCLFKSACSVAQWKVTHIADFLVHPMKSKKQLLTVKISMCVISLWFNAFPGMHQFASGQVQLKWVIYSTCIASEHGAAKTFQGDDAILFVLQASAGLKILPGNGHFDLATKVVLLLFIKNDSKMEFFFPPCHKLDMVIRLSAIKSVQYVSLQQDTGWFSYSWP